MTFVEHASRQGYFVEDGAGRELKCLLFVVHDMFFFFLSLWVRITYSILGKITSLFQLRGLIASLLVSYP